MDTPAFRASCGCLGWYGWPFSHICPASGACAPDSVFINGLLPAPFSPTKANTSPACTTRSTPSSAMVAPKCFRTPSIRRSSLVSAIRLGNQLRSQQLLDFGRVEVFGGNEYSTAIFFLRYVFPANFCHENFHPVIRHLLRMLGDYGLDFAFFYPLNKGGRSVKTDQLDFASETGLAQCQERAKG